MYKATKVYDYYKNGHFVTRGTYEQIAKQQEIEVVTLRHQTSQYPHIHRMIHVGFLSPIYKIYENGKLAYHGTWRELERSGQVSKTTFDHWKTSRAKNYDVVNTGKGAFDPLSYKEIEAQKMKNRIEKAEKLEDKEKHPKKRKPGKSKIRPVKMQEFKFSNRWINYQIEGMFKSWKGETSNG